MEKVLIVLIVLFQFVLSGVARAHDEWTTDDTKRQAVYMTFHVIDWAQTRYIAKNPDKFHELNPMIGRHPSVGRVDAHFATGALIHTGIAYMLPSDWRKKFQYITIGIEAGMVGRNYHLGIKTSF